MRSLPKLGRRRYVKEFLFIVLSLITSRRIVMRMLLRLISGLEGSLNYLALWDDPKGIHPKHRLTDYHDFFVKRIKKQWVVMDAGCGNGSLTSDIALKTGAHVTGIDISKENIGLAKENFSAPNINFVCADLQVYDMQRTDVVVMSNVLEHLPNRTDFLSLLRVRTGAQLLLLRVPQYERHWMVPFGEELGVDMLLDPTHCIEHHIGTLVAELAAAGWTVRFIEAMWGEYRLEAIPEIKGGV